MRSVGYVLWDGSKTKDYEKATNTNKPFTVELEKVEEAEKPKTPIRQAMIDQFGLCTPSLKDKVVL